MGCDMGKEGSGIKVLEHNSPESFFLTTENGITIVVMGKLILFMQMEVLMPDLYRTDRYIPLRRNFPFDFPFCFPDFPSMGILPLPHFCSFSYFFYSHMETEK